MLFIPAIDLKSGQCVRLRQGDMNQSTVFAEDPAGVACEWLEQGARRLHLVDLDGAIAGAPKNGDAIQRIVAAVAGRVPIQLGGGVRDLSTIETVLGWGLQYVILGTAAVQNPPFLREACERFPGRIMAGLDARGGRVAVEGWVRQTELLAVDLAKTMVAAGVSAIVYTDIGRDGMLSGVNVEATKALATAVTLCVFASGGVSGLLDVDLLCDAASSGIAGAIVGRALYDGSLTLTAIQKRVAQRA